MESSLKTKGSLANTRKDKFGLAGFLLGVVAFGVLIALPGFVVFYWMLDASVAVSAVCGALVGFFGWQTLNGVVGVVGIIVRRFGRKKSNSTDK